MPSSDRLSTIFSVGEFSLVAVSGSKISDDTIESRIPAGGVRRKKAAGFRPVSTLSDGWLEHTLNGHQSHSCGIWLVIEMAEPDPARSRCSNLDDLKTSQIIQCSIMKSPPLPAIETCEI